MGQSTSHDILLGMTKRSTLPMLSALTFLSFLDTPLLIPIMALFATQLNANVGMVGFIIGIHAAVGTPASIYFGRIVDRFSYKVPLILGLIGDTIGLFLYTVCRTPEQLLMVRMLHGVSSAVAGPATMSAMAAYARTSKGKVMAFYGISIAMANLVGQGTSGIIGSKLGYNSVFLIGAGLMAVATIIAFFLPGSTGQEHGKKSVSLGENTMRIIKLIGRKGLTMSYTTIFAQYFAFGAMATLLPLYVKGFNMTAFHVGMLLAVFTLFFIIIQMPSGHISDRVGRVVPTIIGLSLAIIALVVLPSFNTFALLAIPMAVYGLAYGLFFPSVSASVADHALPEERGMATGIFYAALTAGVAIGAPVMGWIGQAFGVRSALMLTPVFMVPAIIIAAASLKKTKAVQSTH
ncbi:MAG: MFS transporter [Dehalococcoidales bacterium]|nr:MFS transporter [Dehalococcoidales bacterium]